MCSTLAAAMLAACLSQAAAQGSGFATLLTGDTLTGWTVEHPGPDHARVDGDTVFIDHSAGWVRTDRKKFGDFRLRFQVKGAAGSQRPLVGLFGFSPDADGRVRYPGLPTSAFAIPLFADLPTSKDIGTANLRVLQPDRSEVQRAIRGADAWQEYDITRSGASVVVLLNGVRVIQTRGPMTLDGWIGFMTDRETLSVRSIEIAEIPGPPALPPGVFQPGNDVLLPHVLKQVRPNYTREAMRAQIQGIVVLEGIVEIDGTLNQIQVIRSLDANYGLDEEAVKAARQWRFSPGTRQGEPVRVAITIELSFTLRK